VLADSGPGISLESEEDEDSFNTERDQRLKQKHENQEIEKQIQKNRKRKITEDKINAAKLHLLKQRKEQNSNGNSQMNGLFDIDGKPLVHEFLYIDNNLKLKKQIQNTYK
jgi:hypothetical protein